MLTRVFARPKGLPAVQAANLSISLRSTASASLLKGSLVCRIARPTAGDGPDLHLYKRRLREPGEAPTHPEWPEGRHDRFRNGRTLVNLVDFAT